MNNRNNDFGIVGSNVFYYIFNGIFTGVSQFLFLSFLGRYLSPANFGSTSFIYQLATFMAVFSLLGLDVAFQRETYSIFIKNEKEGLNLVLKYSSKRILLGIIAISAVLISFSVIFQKLMNEILITIILIPLFLLRTLLNSIFIGFEKGKYLLFTNIVGWTAILSLIFYFRFINQFIVENIIISLFIGIFLIVISGIILYQKIAIKLPRRRSNNLVYNEKEDLEKFKDISNKSISFNLMYLSFISESIFIGFSFNQTEIAFFNKGYTIAFIFYIITVGVSSALIPYVSKCITLNKDMKETKSFYRLIFKYFYLFLLIFIVIVLIYPDIPLTLFYGINFSIESYYVTRYLMVWIIIYCIFRILVMAWLIGNNEIVTLSKIGFLSIIIFLTSNLIIAFFWELNSINGCFPLIISSSFLLISGGTLIRKKNLIKIKDIIIPLIITLMSLFPMFFMMNFYFKLENFSSKLILSSIFFMTFLILIISFKVINRNEIKQLVHILKDMLKI